MMDVEMVDKLAGMAQPIAEEAVRQVILRGWLGIWTGLAFTLVVGPVLIGCGIYLIRQKNIDVELPAFFCGLLGGLAVLSGIIICIVCISQVVAPLPTLLGR